MAGFHSLAAEELTVAGTENLVPFWVAAKMAALPFLHPCQATQTRPWESVVAAASISEPGALLILTLAPGFPFSSGRAHTSKLPLSFCDQKTQTRPEPS